MGSLAAHEVSGSGVDGVSQCCGVGCARCYATLVRSSLKRKACASFGEMLRSLVVTLGLFLTAARSATAQQQLGHKLLGGVGIDAGSQSEPGLYISDRLMWYSTNTLKDRNGNVVPVPGLDIDAYGNMLGLGFTTQPGGARSPYLSFAAGVPLARVSIRVDDPRTLIDRSGLGDVFVQPVKVGWRKKRHDVVAMYGFYAPTGKFEPRTGSGVGRGYWTHQLSIGGAAYGESDRMRRASALVSYDLNLKKRGIDIRRGNTLQIQGGAGVGLFKVVTVGIAGFAMWQVSDDVGADIPPALRGLSTRAFGIGPEIDILIPSLRLKAELRFEREFGVRSRPEGEVLVGGVGHHLWRPSG